MKKGYLIAVVIGFFVLLGIIGSFIPDPPETPRVRKLEAGQPKATPKKAEASQPEKLGPEQLKATPEKLEAEQPKAITAREDVEKPAAPLKTEEEKKVPYAPTIFDSRTWTSADGQRTFVGKLTKMGDGQLTVEKDGEEITFPMEKLSDADRRFLGQGVTITTVDGVTHENGSVIRISADAILFKKESGPVSISMESLPESLRQHFAYDPEIAAELHKAKERQLAIIREQQAAADAAAQQQQAAADARQEAQNKLDSFMAVLEMSGARNGIVTNVSTKGNTVIVTVGNVWHYQPKRVRLQTARLLWQAWAMIASPEAPDNARISFRDATGSEVGGSRLIGGSMIWVED